MSWAFDVAARTLCQEARGEPLEGQQAVAWVMKNRLASGRWGASLASVCLWPFQFSGWRATDPNFAYACSLRDDDPVLAHMQGVLQAALDGTDDPTGGAMWYHATGITPPTWAAGAISCGQFGNQLFFKGVK